MLENLDKNLPCGGRQAVRPAGVDDAAVEDDGVAAPEGRVNVWAKQLPSRSCLSVAMAASGREFVQFEDVK